MSRNIYLIGFMGSGKSVVGARLARALGRRFLDTDREIERISGLTVSRLFARDGEPRFRALEERAVAAASRFQDRVVSVGGGAVLKPKNVSTMRRSGTVVYLVVPLAELCRRVEHDGAARRPLLAAAGPKERRALMGSLLKRRLPLYRKAAHVSVRAARRPERVVSRIVKVVGEA